MTTSLQTSRRILTAGALVFFLTNSAHPALADVPSGAANGTSQYAPLPNVPTGGADDHSQKNSNAPTPKVLATTVVRDVADPGTAPGVDASSATIAQIPGLASVVNSADVEKGRSSNAQDVLAYQPGVFAQATSGNTANKISIRGSGLNTFYQGYVLGTKFLYDGLPITGPGGTQEDLLDLAALNYTEVLNGANAFTYASTSLGGAINFVTNTGYSAPGYYGRFEFGSFGYSKEQVSVGGVEGNNDYYVTLVHDQRTGFQANTPNRGSDAIVNLGHRFNQRWDTRLIVRFRKEKLVNGSTLTKEQIKNDPTLNPTPGGRLEDGTVLVSGKATYTIDDQSKLEIGADYHHYPLHNGWIYSTTPQNWTSDDLNATIRYLRQDELFSKIPSNSTLIVSDTRLVKGYVNGLTGKDGTTQTLRQYTQYGGSQDAVIAFGNELELINQKLWFSADISEIGITRNVSIEKTVLLNPTTFPTSVRYAKWYSAPRVGLRYALAKNLQLFTNVSRSVDGPVTWQMGSTGSGYVRPLVPQTANTGEVGIHGTWGIFDGSLALYRSWVKDELLTVIISPATPTADAVTANSNATPTIHQGVEAGLTTRLWQSSAGDLFSLRQAYTLNDFYYEHDTTFGGNKLPSLPNYTYQAELHYQQAKGFYAGVNLRAASTYYVDFANTLKAPSYAIWGATAGYETPHWKVFLDLKNIGDTHYATTANTAFNLHGIDSANFYPGDGFSIIGGVSFHF